MTQEYFKWNERYLNSERSNDQVDTSTINADAVTESEIDLSITPTWTGKHTFNKGLAVKAGGSIEDDRDIERIGFPSNGTTIHDNDGKRTIDTTSGFATQLRANSQQFVGIFDEESSSFGVKYISDINTGTLELTNADFVAVGAKNRYGQANTTITVDALTNTDSKWVTFGNTNGNGAFLRNQSGELVGKDSGGQTTTLT